VEAKATARYIRVTPRKLRRSVDGLTRVLVSHDVSGALEESDVAIGLRDGRPAPVDAELYR